MVCLASVPGLAAHDYDYDFEEELQWAETWQEGVIYKLEGQLPIGSHQDDDAQFNPSGGVVRLPRKRVENTLDIRFFVIGDPHFTAEYNIIAHNDTHYYIKNPGLPALRAVSNNINTTCNWFKEHGLPGCIGGVSVGDMTRSGSDGFLPHHSVYYYRCLYDYDSDCNEDQKSHALNRYKIKYPVFPTLGNHDDPTEFDHAGAIRDYIRYRVNHSLALFQRETVENYYMGNGSDIYAWEWGSFHFINMGLWAFYDKKDKDHDNRATVDPQKISWLQRHLGAIGKEKVIILFQHFGWDGFSFNGDWWSHDNAELLRDLICDREVKVGGSTACDNPYNVVAIFTGHNHEWGYGGDILYGEGPRKIPNYQVDDAGHDLKNNEGQSGYFHVRLNMKDGHLDAEGNFVGKMEVNQIKLTPASDPKDEEHIVEITRTAVEPWKTRDITTEFLRFDQGEPNSHGADHCAEIKSNGRYNDTDCAGEKYIICYDPDGKEWHISDYKHAWPEGFEMCHQSGWEFKEPKTVEDQRDIIQLMADTGRNPAWVNYTDLLDGLWEEGPEYLGFFDHGQPDNGGVLFPPDQDENCAELKENGRLNDVECESRIFHYACKDGTGLWFISKAKGIWSLGFNYCEQESGSFAAPEDFYSLDDLIQARAEANMEIWINFNDIKQEGRWVANGQKPWTGWAPDEPGEDQSKNCAKLTSEGVWYDGICELEKHAACSNDHIYWQITEKPVKWHDAFKACYDYDFTGHITEKDNEKLKQLIAHNGLDDLWINLTDRKREGTWVRGHWTNWGSGEPDNNGVEGNEDCAVINKDGTWSDVSCDQKLYPACKIKGAFVYGWVELEELVTWYEAESACNYFDMRLGMPDNPQENQDLLNKMKHGQLWIRYNDVQEEGFWVDYIQK
jgi:hypothetical protein